MTKDEIVKEIRDLVYSSHRCTIDIEVIVDKINKDYQDKYNELLRKHNNGKERYEANLMAIEDCSNMTTKQALELKSFDSEGIFETNEQGFIVEFPQFGKFGANKKIELFSKEVK